MFVDADSGGGGKGGLTGPASQENFKRLVNKNAINHKIG
jgi:hypothetical protein